MKFISVVLRSVLIITLFPCIMSVVAGSEKPDPAEEALKAIEDCIASSPTPWPDEWKREYIQTIRNAISPDQDVPLYTTRLEILRNGFAPYWVSFRKTNESSLFEVNRAQIRWYIEHLMSTEFPSEDEQKKLRNQYKNLLDHAADSLLKQFPFLDPNAVQRAKQDNLSIYYTRIDAPLMPIYLRPMSEMQLEQIKERWDKLRYIRVDLWRRLNGNSKTRAEIRDSPSFNTERDHELTKKCLEQLSGQIWICSSDMRASIYRGREAKGEIQGDEVFPLGTQARGHSQT